jgi:CheY-like chemotaxis protein
VARVTVVNDNPDFLDLVGDLLGELNYETTLIDGDRADALASIAGSEPDVLIVDLRMGSDAMHGWDVAQQVRAEPTLDGLPILVCSADRDALEAIATDLASVQRVSALAKPFSVDEFIAAVEQLLEVARPPSPEPGAAPVG